LGLPLGASYQATSLWNSIIKKLKKKNGTLVGWMEEKKKKPLFKVD
jgi:hypothetical protein